MYKRIFRAKDFVELNAEDKLAMLNCVLAYATNRGRKAQSPFVSLFP